MKLKELKREEERLKRQIKELKVKYKDVPKQKTSVIDRVKGLKHIYRGLKGAFKEILLVTYAKIFGYYKSVHKLPIHNWDEALKGDYSYLYKRRIKNTPRFFERLQMHLFFQLEKVNMDYFNDILKLKYLQSLHITTKNAKYLNQANSLKAAMKKKKKPVKTETLNGMVTIIEEMFNDIGKINIFKISTSRFYSLYYRAIEKRTDLMKKNKLYEYNKKNRFSRK